jgi:choline dehydrogenase
MRYQGLAASIFCVFALLAIASATKYDYIVAGAGTAGCVVAARLSENPNVKVLLVTNGEDQTGKPENQLPLVKPIVSPVPTDYIRFADYTLSTEGPNYGANGRKSSVVLRPRLFGGGSSVNGGAFIRPANSDYDILTNDLGLSHWSVDEINAIWPKIETFHPESGPVPPGHGTTGPINSRAVSPDLFLSLYAASIQNVTGSVSNPDMGLGNIRGSGVTVRPLGGPANVTVTGDYVRQDSWTRYIVPILDRRNLDVVDRATVVSVTEGPSCKKINRNTPCINELTYVRENKVETVRVKRGGEIILSTGSIETPKILMHSGIGNCADLATHGISCVKDIPLMSKRIYEHISFATTHIIPATSPSWPAHIGSLTSTYLSTRPDNRVNIEITATGLPIASLGYHLVITQVVLTVPESYGEIRLKDGDWNTAVNISFNIFGNLSDKQPLLYSYKKIVEAAARTTASGIPMIQTGPASNILPAGATDAQILAWLTDASFSDYHTVATTPMGKCANGSTVDDQLRVCGVDGLRVADNGVMPFPYAAHSTHTGALIIGEQVAHFIKDF